MNIIVTTTIHAPTEAIEKFDALPNWKLIVIGDRKTPGDFHLDRGMYVPPLEQEQYDRWLSDALGWDCIQRRNFGFLLAKDMGADVIATVDDDNIPLPGWGENLLLGREVEVSYYKTDQPAFDPLVVTNYPYLWHRGFPLELLQNRNAWINSRLRVCPDVQADFWNGDPDVDAICRLEHQPECRFDPRSFPFTSNRIGPFNSQNTFLTVDCLRDYFVFPFVGRMDDIWASYYLQSQGRRVVWGAPSVYQRRNPHDLMRDLREERLGHDHNLKIIQQPSKVLTYLPPLARKAFRLYQRHFA